MNKDVRGLEVEVLEYWKADQSSAMEFGKALIALKAAYKVKGQFGAFLRKNNISYYRAQYAMRIATGARTTTQYKDTPCAIAVKEGSQLLRQAYGAVRDNDLSALNRLEKQILGWFQDRRKQLVLAKAA